MAARSTATKPRNDPSGPVLEADQILDAHPGALLELQPRGEIDIQIATALRYPRSIEQFKQKALAMATLDEETAASCFYVLPRRKGSDKSIEGPSARLAEIVASAWRHMRVVGRTVEEGDRFVTLFGGAWDLETNVARAVEVRRRITTKDGGRYNDDMIAVTCNAGIAIATRNAVFQVVPKAYWWPIYLQCREVAVGSAKTLGARRVQMLEYFQKLGVEPPRVFALLEVRGVDDITLEHLATLKGLATAIKEGDTSIDDAFLPAGTVHGARPVDEALAKIPEIPRAMIVDAFTRLRLNEGQRLVHLRSFAGQPEKLLEVLNGLIEAEKADPDASPTSVSQPPNETAGASSAPSLPSTSASSSGSAQSSTPSPKKPGLWSI